MKTICIVNHKGGVGKTATALAVAEGLSRRGKETLLIDLDPQCNASDSLNWTSSEDGSDDVAVNAASLFVASPIDSNQIVKIESLNVIPAVQDLAMAEKSLHDYSMLTAHLKTLSPSLDFCIIDTPPALNNLTLSALSACDYVLIPAHSDVYSLNGIKQLKETLNAVKESNKRIQVLGIVFTYFEPRLVLSRLIESNFNEIAESLNSSIFKTRIRKAQAIPEAATTKTSIYEYAPKSSVVQDYEDFVDEILERIN